MSNILKKYVCISPFRYLDIQPISQYICCPSWNPTNIRENGWDPVNTSEDLLKNWNSVPVQEVRKSVMDGSYRHCNHKICPSLSSLINTGQPTSILIEKSKFEQDFNIRSLEDIKNYQGLPEEILFGFDVHYRQLVHWEKGKYSIKEVNDISIFDQMHPLFNNFILELKKICNLEKVNHNFHHLL